jgi:hypothetical protein
MAAPMGGGRASGSKARAKPDTGPQGNEINALKQEAAYICFIHRHQMHY